MEKIEVQLSDNKKFFHEGLIELLKSIVIPLAIGFSTYYYTIKVNQNNIELQKQINDNDVKIKYIGIATTILSDNPTKENEDLRKWATNILNTNSAIKLNSNIMNSLIQTIPLGYNSYFLNSNQYNFQWKPIKNAKGYDLEIQESNDGENWTYYGGKCLTGNQITTFIPTNAEHIRWKVTPSGQMEKDNWKYIK